MKFSSESEMRFDYKTSAHENMFGYGTDGSMKLSTGIQTKNQSVLSELCYLLLI